MTTDLGLTKEELEDIKNSIELTINEAIKGDMIAQLLVIVHSDITILVAEMLMGYESKTITKTEILKFVKIALDAISKRIATQVATLSTIAQAAGH